MNVKKRACFKILLIWQKARGAFTFFCLPPEINSGQATESNKEKGPENETPTLILLKGRNARFRMQLYLAF